MVFAKLLNLALIPGLFGVPLVWFVIAIIVLIRGAYYGVVVLTVFIGFGFVSHSESSGMGSYNIKSINNNKTYRKPV